ncbi:hypothetical protein DM02DRAFT_612010 [Periconia macrospinosa]|uniref:Uncharacterized protein n=1 Tax=Periconia macrospinosa TaxID=97972 RepID=A0A2V1DZF0_9PLEO|nr:hypothetical protein DM02DRAFT_612010 [Periconia macrospinosa]
MMLTNTLALAGAFALSVTAAPVGQNTFKITPDQLTSIDVKTASCNGAPFPEECADATVAAPAISTSFEKYQIKSRGAQAALIALMVFESGSFKYNKNHFPAPGRPGQGTRNMQMADFNREYATQVLPSYTVASASVSKLVDLLNEDDALSFGSAAWFLKKKCPSSIEAGLESGSLTGWDAYLTQCIGTTHTTDRDVAWNAAKKALNVGQYGTLPSTV